MTAYIDLVSTPGQLQDYQYDVTRKSTVLKAMELTADDTVFDISYTLDDTTDNEVSIYAAKGVWNTVTYSGGSGGGATPASVSAVTSVQQTPWAIYKVMAWMSGR